MTDIVLIPRQFDFVADDSPWSLVFGGRGSTKTTALCYGAWVRACVVGASEFMARQKLIDFKTTTLKNLIEGVGGFPPEIQPGTYHHNKELKTIKIYGGGEIVYNGMDQGDVGRQMGSTGKGSSLNVSGAHFDEAAEMQEASVIQVCMGVRVKVPGLKLVRRFACNPSLPSNWVAKRWGLALDHVARKGHVSRHLDPRDNWHLPDEFIEELEALDGVARERYLEGKWVGSDGLVFDRFNRNIHVREIKKSWKGQILGVDDGYTDPFTVVDARWDSDGRYHIVREVHETKLVQTEKIDRVKALWDGNSLVVVDSSEPDLIESMRRAGINAIGADKGQGSIEFGINLVQTELVVQDDGLPRMTVDPSCTNTIREFESHERVAETGKPRDRDNHMMDPIRYLVRHRTQERGTRVVGSDPSIITPDKEAVKVASFADMRQDQDWGWD